MLAKRERGGLEGARDELVSSVVERSPLQDYRKRSSLRIYPMINENVRLYFNVLSSLIVPYPDPKGGAEGIG